MIDIRFEPAAQRTAAYDGEKLIGVCSYTLQDGKWAADHTEVSPDYRGQRIANRLLDALIEAARAEGAEIVPVCSFVVKAMRNA